MHVFVYHRILYMLALYGLVLQELAPVIRFAAIRFTLKSLLAKCENSAPSILACI